jgi:hypothetical protein
VLEVETRGFTGPRTYDSSGIPLREDNQTIVRERIYLDKSDPNIFHDEVTVIDHALTHPWIVTKSYRREPDRQPSWREVVCAETNKHVEIGKQNYMLSPDGRLMPTRKDQHPPEPAIFQSLPEGEAVDALASLRTVVQRRKDRHEPVCHRYANCCHRRRDINRAGARGKR